MNLTHYLSRIGFAGTPRPDLDTLTRIHRLHLEAIPYENLDVQLGRRVGLDQQAIFDKLVTERRGGWCFEMNGLLAWALEAIGFRLTRLAGAVMRERLGESVVGNHLALWVHLERSWLADVGFGDGLIEPTPLDAGAIRQEFLDFRLEPIEDDWWRFHNHPHGGAKSFDFQLRPARTEVLAERCEWLQSSPESNFVLNAVCQRFVNGELRILRGRMLRIIRARGVDETMLGSVTEFAQVLADQFDLEPPQIPFLWDKICARHEQRLAEAGGR